MAKRSLKWKFILAFTMIPFISLSVFFLLIYLNFKDERMAAIFETSLTQSRLQTKLTSEKLAPITSFMEYWATFYVKDQEYSQVIARTMKESTSALKNLTSAALIEFDPITNSVTKTLQLKWSPEPLVLARILSQLEIYRSRLDGNPKPILVNDLHPKDWVMIQRYKPSNPQNNNREIIVVAAINQRWTRLRYPGQVISENFWFNDQGQVIAQNGQLGLNEMAKILKRISSSKSVLGAFEIELGGTPFIAAYSLPQQAQVVMVNLIKAELAEENLRATLQQGILLLLIIILISLVGGIFLSNKLTHSLQVLARATKTLGRGIFNIRINIKSGDEVEDLSHSITDLAQQIQLLLKETKDLGRMEGELLLGKEVQTTLFPPEFFENHHLSIRGYNQPASEVGGDWWGYYESTDHTYVFVGDATGHGVPAALLTTAIHSIVKTLFNLGVDSPPEMLKQMNRALFQTSQGKKTMTLALLKIEKASGQLRYGIAGHEAPLLLRNLTQETRLKDLVSLDAESTKPLGLSEDSVYVEQTIALEPNDYVLLFSDGIVDARDKSDKPWGERRFTKTVTDAIINNYNLDSALEEIKKSFKRQTEGRPLIDDVTICLVQYYGPK